MSLFRHIALACACAFSVCAAAADPTPIDEPAPAAIATLVVVDGVVMVNAGERFVNAKVGQPLAAGDRIMVLSGAKAKLRFADDCALSLAQNSVAVVPPKSTCAGAIADVREYGPMYAQAVGSSGTDAETVTTETTVTTKTTAETEDDDDECGDDRNDDGVDDDRDGVDSDGDGEDLDDNRACIGWWIAGGALAGWAIYEAIKDDDRSPVSN